MNHIDNYARPAYRLRVRGGVLRRVLLSRAGTVGAPPQRPSHGPGDVARPVPESDTPRHRPSHSSSTPARDLAHLSTMVCWTLGGTGSYDLNSIVYEPRPAVMLLRSVA